MDYELDFCTHSKNDYVANYYCHCRWPLYQVHVKDAFLQGDLKEIYMKPPTSLFSAPTSDVCKLKQSLYELKQAPKAWFDNFQSTLL